VATNCSLHFIPPSGDGTLAIFWCIQTAPKYRGPETGRRAPVPIKPQQRGEAHGWRASETVTHAIWQSSWWCAACKQPSRPAVVVRRRRPSVDLGRGGGGGAARGRSENGGAGRRPAGSHSPLAATWRRPTDEAFQQLVSARRPPTDRCTGTTERYFKQSFSIAQSQKTPSRYSNGQWKSPATSWSRVSIISVAFPAKTTLLEVLNNTDTNSISLQDNSPTTN